MAPGDGPGHPPTSWIPALRGYPAAARPAPPAIPANAASRPPAIPMVHRRPKPGFNLCRREQFIPAYLLLLRKEARRTGPPSATVCPKVSVGTSITGED